MNYWYYPASQWRPVSALSRIIINASVSSSLVFTLCFAVFQLSFGFGASLTVLPAWVFVGFCGVFFVMLCSCFHQRGLLHLEVVFRWTWVFLRRLGEMMIAWPSRLQELSGPWPGWVCSAFRCRLCRWCAHQILLACLSRRTLLTRECVLLCGGIYRLLNLGREGTCWRLGVACSCILVGLIEPAIMMIILRPET